MHITGTKSSPYNHTNWYYVPSLFTLNIGEDDPDQKVSENMTRKYCNHKLQTNPLDHEEEVQNTAT